MVLVDSSCWVHHFRRRGDEAIKKRLVQLLEAGEAAWCPFIRLELWNGVGSDYDRRVLREHEAWLPDLAITEAVWKEAFELANRCRKAGKTAPAGDVLIAACARHYRIPMEYSDAHFDFLLAL